MKQVFLAVGLLISINTISQAQTLSYGAQVGVGISNVVTDYPELTVPILVEQIPKIYFSINAFLSVKGKGFLGFSLEPGFAQKGNRFEYSANPNPEENILRLNYIQLPVLLDFHINNDICISLGPEFSLLTKTVLQVSGDKFTLDGYEDFEFSGLITARFRITEHLSTGLRYNYGFSSITGLTFTDNNGQPVGRSENKNRYFQVFFRYNI